MFLKRIFPGLAGFPASPGKGLIVTLILITLVLAGFASRVRPDNSGVAFDVIHSESAKTHQAFVDSFGRDDYILLAFAHGILISDPGLRQRLRQAGETISAMDGVIRVIDLDRLTRTRVPGVSVDSSSWNPADLSRMRGILPGIPQLVSSDTKVLGMVVRIDNEVLNGFRLEERVRQFKAVIQTAFPAVKACHAAGIPVLRAAFERYNLINAVIFGGLGLVFGTLIAFYLFKTLWAGVLVGMTATVSLIWVLGIMGITGIRVNLASGLSFGFVLIVSCTTVFHVLSAYLACLKNGPSGTAMVRAFNQVLRPCFMCALTTAAGFFSLTVSQVPMVRQAGIIIGLGVILAFGLAVPITAFWLPRKLRGAEDVSSPEKQDCLNRMVTVLKLPGFYFPKITLGLSLVFCLIMAAGIPAIQTTKHLTLPMVDHTPEAEDMAFIREHLSTGYSVSVVFTDPDTVFSSRRFWYDLAHFETRLKQLKGIDHVDAITSLVFRTALMSPAGIMPERVFDRFRAMTGPPGLSLMDSFYDASTGRLRVEVHIRDHSSDQIEALLKEIRKTADGIFDRSLSTDLAGQLIYLRSQTTGLVASQLKTLGLALSVITLFMMIQLGSVTLGLLSLIPNLLPLFSIFGIMGWFGIALDPLTIFAAVISFGLSVDDSIHYLTALKEKLAAGKGVAPGLDAAYAGTARALISTTAVLFLSASGLFFSSFSHVLSLGVLVASASLAALIGDLMILPALVRTSGLVYKQIEKTI